MPHSVAFRQRLHAVVIRNERRILGQGRCLPPIVWDVDDTLPNSLHEALTRPHGRIRLGGVWDTVSDAQHLQHGARVLSPKGNVCHNTWRNHGRALRATPKAAPPSV